MCIRARFQPEAALVIPEEVFPGDAYRIGIGGACVTGEEEEVDVYKRQADGTGRGIFPDMR